MLAFSLQGTDLLVEHMNVKKATLKYYLIDPEILFSRAPFLLQNTEDFSYVQAALAHDVQLDPNVRSTVVPIPPTAADQELGDRGTNACAKCQLDSGLRKATLLDLLLDFDQGDCL